MRKTILILILAVAATALLIPATSYAGDGRVKAAKPAKAAKIAKAPKYQIVAAPAATLTAQDSDLAFNLTGLTAGSRYSASFVVDETSCIGHNAQTVRDDGTVTFLADRWQLDWVRPGWTHVTAMLQTPGAACGLDPILTATYTEAGDL